MESVSLFNAYNGPELEEIAVEVLRSGSLASGKYVEKFESGFSELAEQQNIVAVDNMTSAIYIALRVAGVAVGDEVAALSFACLSTNAAIAMLGAKPVWVDLEEDSIWMSPAALQKVISKKTKAVLVYHVAGYPAPIEEISNICKRHGIILIEDCNNSLLAKSNEKLVGTFGDISVYSFYANRQLQTIDGGAISFKNENQAFEARKLRRFGIDYRSFRGGDGEISALSDIKVISDSRIMSNFSAALGFSQLEGVKARIEKTQKNALKLTSLISNLPTLQVISSCESSSPVYWALIVKVNGRDNVLKKLKSVGVSVSKLHQQNDIYSGFNCSRLTDLRNTRDLQEKILALPCGWWVSGSQLKYIAQELKNAI